VDGVGGAVESAAGTSSGAPEAAELTRTVAKLTHQLASLASRHQALERDYAAATALRRRGFEGGRLIPATVVAADALPWRQSRLINAGLLSGVREAAGVTTNQFTIHTAAAKGASKGLAVVTGELLIGFVDQVSTHSARVRLVTDRATTMPVVVARLEEKRLLPLEAQFWLAGTGGPLIEVRDVDHRYIKSGAIKKGDLVLTTPHDARLPVPLTVGSVSRIRRDPDNRLLYLLDVEPGVDLDQVRRVFVVDPHGDGAW
jgi:cell shape-determining protein MreC